MSPDKQTLTDEYWDSLSQKQKRVLQNLTNANIGLGDLKASVDYYFEGDEETAASYPLEVRKTRRRIRYNIKRAIDVGLRNLDLIHIQAEAFGMQQYLRDALSK